MLRQPISLLRGRALPCPSRRPMRRISIQATPASSSPTIDSADAAVTSLNTPSINNSSPSSTAPDARFEVLGTTSSLLSVSLSASQNLYTRRGTLVGVSGSPDNAISTLSLLSPLARAPFGIPFLYQRISSATPLNILIATKAPHTSMSVINLDGRVDWAITQRSGLLAWSGHTLQVDPSLNLKMSLAHWGNSTVTGRGLVALAASGNTYQVTLKADEQYVVHPSSVLAYTINPNPPQPYRFKSSTLRLQLPSFASGMFDTKFFHAMRETKSYRFIGNTLYTLRTWTRKTIFGDRLFLQFQGPTTILLQSRGSRIRDALTSADANEIANATPGVIEPMPSVAIRGRDSSSGSSATGGGAQHVTSTKMSYARVEKSGTVSFSEK